MPLYTRNDDKDEAELKALEEAKQQKEKEVKEQEKDTTDWAKRYADLRSYEAKQANKHEAEIKALKEQLENAPKTNTAKLTAEDVEKWRKSYPESYEQIARIVKDEIQANNEELKKELETVRTASSETAKEAAKDKLAQAHPDFFDSIAQDSAFFAWLDTQSKATKDSILVNETDWKTASTTIQAYKDHVELNKYRKSASDATSTASMVTTKGKTTPNTKEVKGRVYKESEISSMQPTEFAKLEEDIDKARLEGRIIYGE